MSFTVVGKTKVYASIDDLTEVGGIGDGDRFLIQTEDGTALVDYENVKIDLDHVTFAERFTGIESFMTSCEVFINQFTDEFVTFKDDVNKLAESDTHTTGKVEAMKLITALTCGTQEADGGGSEVTIEALVRELPTDGQTLYNELIADVRSKVSADFSFTTSNLYRVSALTDSVADVKEELLAVKETLKDVEESASDAKNTSAVTAVRLDDVSLYVEGLNARVTALEERQVEISELLEWFAANREVLDDVVADKSTSNASLSERLKAVEERIGEL